MQVVILCGGKGTRAYPYTEHISKPMLPICGQPILAKVMSIYAHQGIKEFILSLGYRKEGIVDYFTDRVMDWKVNFVNTGLNSDTGERIEKCKEWLGDTFMATYADGVGNIDMGRLLEFHKSHGALATLTTVRLPSQYGTVVMDDNGVVKEFKEKPVIREHWINAGFFVFEKKVFDYWEGKNLEREVLPRLASEHHLFAYRHEGFWKSMDTYKDHQDLEQIFLENEHLCRVEHAVPTR